MTNLFTKLLTDLRGRLPWLSPVDEYHSPSYFITVRGMKIENMADRKYGYSVFIALQGHWD